MFERVLQSLNWSHVVLKIVSKGPNKDAVRAGMSRMPW